MAQSFSTRADLLKRTGGGFTGNFLIAVLDLRSRTRGAVGSFLAPAVVDDFLMSPERMFVRN